MKWNHIGGISIGMITAIFGLARCSGLTGSGGGSAANIVISGSLSSNSLQVARARSAPIEDVNATAVQFEDLDIVATASTNPPSTVSASVNVDGSFSTSLGSDAAGTPVTVTFQNRSTGSIVGEIKFVDDTKKDLSGNSKSDSSVVVTGSLTLGSINLNEDGTIEVPRASIANIQSAAPISTSAAFDPTGNWKMAAYDGNLTGTGFETVGVCDPNHDGPCIGFPITLARFVGKDFTPNNGSCTATSGTTCTVGNGTVGAADRFALSIWGGDYNSSIGACGGVTGFTADEARAFGHISITTLPTIGTSGAMQFGPYVFGSDMDYGGDSAPYNEKWMKTGAMASHDQQDCRPFTVSGTTKTYNAWACKSPVVTGNWPGTPVSGTVGWNVGVQGSGCVDFTTNKPINITNWNTIGTGDCSNEAAADYGTGFNKNTCVYMNKDHDGNPNTANVNFKCTNIGGNFQDSAGNPSATPFSFSNGQYLGRPENIISQGQACSTAGSSNSAQILAGYRCYAEAYWQNGGPQTGCGQEYDFDWQATDPNNFVRRDDFKGKPKNAFVTNILDYSFDGKTATLEDENTESITVPTGPNGSTFCKVVHKTQLTFKSITATKILIELKESGRMASIDAACIAAGNSAASNSMDGDNHLKETLQSQKMIFFVNKN